MHGVSKIDLRGYLEGYQLGLQKAAEVDPRLAGALAGGGLGLLTGGVLGKTPSWMLAGGLAGAGLGAGAGEVLRQGRQAQEQTDHLVREVQQAQEPVATAPEEVQSFVASKEPSEDTLPFLARHRNLAAGAKILPMLQVRESAKEIGELRNQIKAWRKLRAEDIADRYRQEAAEIKDDILSTHRQMRRAAKTGRLAMAIPGALDVYATRPWRADVAKALASDPWETRALLGALRPGVYTTAALGELARAIGG